eukprot:g5800.t1
MDESDEETLSKLHKQYGIEVLNKFLHQKEMENLRQKEIEKIVKSQMEPLLEEINRLKNLIAPPPPKEENAEKGEATLATRSLHAALEHKKGQKTNIALDGKKSEITKLEKLENLSSLSEEQLQAASKTTAKLKEDPKVPEKNDGGRHQYNNNLNQQGLQRYNNNKLTNYQQIYMQQQQNWLPQSVEQARLQQQQMAAFIIYQQQAAQMKAIAKSEKEENVSEKNDDGNDDKEEVQQEVKPKGAEITNGIEAKLEENNIKKNLNSLSEEELQADSNANLTDLDTDGDDTDDTNTSDSDDGDLSGDSNDRTSDDDDLMKKWLNCIEKMPVVDKISKERLLFYIAFITLRSFSVSSIDAPMLWHVIPSKWHGRYDGIIEELRNGGNYDLYVRPINQAFSRLAENNYFKATKVGNDQAAYIPHCIDKTFKKQLEDIVQKLKPVDFNIEMEIETKNDLMEKWLNCIEEIEGISKEKVLFEVARITSRSLEYGSSETLKLGYDSANRLYLKKALKKAFENLVKNNYFQKTSDGSYKPLNVDKKQLEDIVENLKAKYNFNIKMTIETKKKRINIV